MKLDVSMSIKVKNSSISDSHADGKFIPAMRASLCQERTDSPYKLYRKYGL